MFIILVFVITKAGGNRPNESLATSRTFEKVLHSIRPVGKDNVEFFSNFLQ
jgi:hypothetical protein